MSDLTIKDVAAAKKKLEKGLATCIQAKLDMFMLDLDRQMFVSGITVNVVGLSSGFPRQIKDSAITSIDVTLSVANPANDIGGLG